MKRLNILMKHLFLFLFLFLVGCGFTPLYISQEMNEKAAMIEISPIDGALGQQLRSNLEHRFNPSGVVFEKPYRLNITLKETEVSKQGIRQDDTATRITISLTGNYTLYYNNEKVLSEKSYFLSSYNILQDPYSSYVSHKDTLKQLTDLVADDIALRIGLYLKDN